MQLRCRQDQKTRKTITMKKASTYAIYIKKKVNTEKNETKATLSIEIRHTQMIFCSETGILQALLQLTCYIIFCCI